MLNKKDIQHIADLARLDLTEEELEKYGGQLTRILGYIDQLQEVNTDGVEPAAAATGENVWREDEVLEWDKEEVKKALEEAPESEEGQLKVKRVL